MTLNDSHPHDVKELLNQQRLLQATRKKVSKIYHKNIFIISGDQSARETLKGYLETLGFPSEKVRSSNTSATLISRIKQLRDNVDLIICHLKALDSRVSTQTGIQLMKIVNDMLLNTGIDHKIPFVFAEKEFDRKDIMAACKAGANQFLILPGDPISMGSKLMEVFETPKDSIITKEVTKLLLEANKLQEQGLFEQAIVFYNKALQLGGENSEILVEKGNALMKMGKTEEAIKSFIQSTEYESNFPRAHQGLGRAYEQLGEFDKAKKHYLKVVEMEPHNVQVLYSLGLMAQDEGDYEEAGNYFQNGVNLNKKFVKNFLGLAKYHEAKDNPKQALEVYKEAIENNPNQTFLYLTVGDFCLKHNLDSEAENLFGEAISLNEKHIHLYNRMGIALRKQEKYDQSIANFNRAIRIKPEDPNLHYNLAKAHYLSGDDSKAMDVLNRAFSLDPYLKFKFEEDHFFSKLMEKYPEKFSI